MRCGRLCCLALGLALASIFVSPRLAAEEAPNFDLVTIPGGTFAMGARVATPGHPRTSVRVETFALMRTEVTNAQFAAFVAASGHQTDPERKGWGYSWDGRWARPATPTASARCYGRRSEYSSASKSLAAGSTSTSRRRSAAGACIPRSRRRSSATEVVAVPRG